MSRRLHSALLVLGVLPALVAACTRSPRDPELATLLERSPNDDRAWSAALDGAVEEERLEPFATAARRLADENAAAWAPAWIAGEAWSALEREREAREDFRNSLERAQAAGVDVGIAQTCNELGWFAYDDGELTAGADLYAEGIAAAIRAGRDDLQAFLRNNLAGLRVAQGRFAAARDELEIASALLTELGMDGPAAGLRYNRAALEWKLGNVREAAATLEEVRQSATRAGDSWTLAATSVIFGHLARVRGDLAAAAAHYLAVEHDDADVSATAALGLGQVERARGNLPAAQTALLRSAEIAGDEEPLIAALARALHADGRFEVGDTAIAAAALDEAIAAADAAGDGQTAWVARHLLGRRLLPEDPARARLLLDAAVERLESWGDDLDAMGDGLYLLRGRSQVYVDAASAALDEPQRVWELATWSTGRALRAVGERADVLPLDAAVARLQADEAVLVLLAGAGEGVALLVTDAGAVARSAALPGATEIESFAAAVRRGEAFDGEALSAALFGPFEDELQAIDRLWLVVDGALAAMPFGALPWRGEHFGTRFAYAVLPTPGVPRRNAVRSGRGEVLLAGAPLFDNAADTRWAPLPFAARELARLEGMWQERATLLVGDALRAAALETIDWRRFDLIHFATHAEASSVDPRANGLVLADAERFGLDQVLARSFDDATVVLSACSTAEGERVPGQGRLGLVWAFHLAGAAEVVASQWAVDDRSTAETMASLHAALRSGVDAAQAMRRVRRECVASSCPTARWAVFEVYRRP